MKRPARRTILKVLLLLIAGATLNVAVAWGCILIMPASGFRMAEAECLALVVSTRRFDQVRPDDRSAFRHTNYDGTGQRAIGWTRKRAEIELYGLKSDPSGYELHISIVSEAGLPFRSVRALDTHHGSRVHYRALSIPAAIEFYPMEERMLPYYPIWPGFAVNTVFYAGVLWMLCCGPFALRRMIRRRRGLCAACAYPIGQSDVCTECGALHSHAAMKIT